MDITSNSLRAMIEAELRALNDAAALPFIKERLIEPRVVMREWDYGAPGQQYPCWTIFEDRAWDLAIVYCEEGFGPQRPWGMVWIGNSGRPTSMGMDSGWYPTFVGAFLDSQVATELPIWRVYRRDDFGAFEAITRPGEWGAAWEICNESRENPKDARYWVLDSLRDPNQWLS
jgi:hypothetical protein